MRGSGSGPGLSSRVLCSIARPRRGPRYGSSARASSSRRGRRPVSARPAPAARLRQAGRRGFRTRWPTTERVPRGLVRGVARRNITRWCARRTGRTSTPRRKMSSSAAKTSVSSWRAPPTPASCCQTSTSRNGCGDVAGNGVVTWSVRSVKLRSRRLWSSRLPSPPASPSARISASTGLMSSASSNAMPSPVRLPIRISALRSRLLPRRFRPRRGLGLQAGPGRTGSRETCAPPAASKPPVITK